MADRPGATKERSSELHELRLSVTKLEGGFERLVDQVADLAVKMDQQRTRRASPLSVVGTTCAVIAVAISLSIAIMAPTARRLDASDAFDREAVATLTNFAAEIEAHETSVGRNEAELRSLHEDMAEIQRTRFTRADYREGNDLLRAQIFRELDRINAQLDDVRRRSGTPEK